MEELIAAFVQYGINVILFAFVAVVGVIIGKKLRRAKDVKIANQKTD